MKDNSGALEISFGWLFAIIAGIVIIFIAIYFSARFIGTQQETKSAETGREIGILLNPLETSFESAQTTSITIPVDTRINNKCELTGTFGRQLIQLDQKSFNEWTRTDIDVFFYNKYIFSEEQIEGKRFYIFSKPFSFPFKVADLIYMTSANDRYCFIGAPNSVEEEISNLNQANLLSENCSGSEIKVCFNNQDCEINIDYSVGRVEKNGEFVYFDVGNDALMYAGIFAENGIYECQLRRLMLRVKELSLLYIDKETISRKNGCTEDSLSGDLGVLSELAGSLEKSEEIEIVKTKAEDIGDRNDGRLCRLW